MTKNANSSSRAWQTLTEHAKNAQTQLNLKKLFSNDQKRFQKFSFSAPGIFIDLSKQHVSQQIIHDLMQLAYERKLPEKRNAMLSGEFVNTTEKRQALHTALRNPQSLYKAQIQDALHHMLSFAEHIRTNAEITDIVNIGTGGSDLSARMSIQALSPFTHQKKRFHFISNLDAFEISTVLQKIKPENSLFVITSKTFTTQETMANAATARAWFEAAGGKHDAPHFVAVTANTEQARAFGIKQIFKFWDWVGGRYSIWSSVGLCLAIAIGKEGFQEFLSGAHAMDQHFVSTPLEQNLPVLLGMIDVWNRNFLNRSSRCVAPYHQSLNQFPAYLQQLEMESNGKSTSIAGNTLEYATSGVVWGDVGSNGQHAFFQMLHQGTDIIPVDFILVKKALYPPFPDQAQIKSHLQHQHTALLMHGLAQSMALMIGKNLDAIMEELEQTHKTDDLTFLRTIAQHQTFTGNRPSTTMLLTELNPYTLGALMALHEHRTFVTGVIWEINSFDQWGVELGKTIAKQLSQQFETNAHDQLLDSSTKGLMSIINAQDHF